MTEERDERMVAALEAIAASLERLAKPLRQIDAGHTQQTGYTSISPSTSWPAAWSMGVSTS